MNIRRFTLAFSTAFALASATSNASPDTDAVNACARALASRIAAPGAEPPSYKLEYRDSGGGDWSLTSNAPVSIFDLQAHDPKTGVILARARCSTNRRGAIVAFTLTSGNEKSATLWAER